jgi:hypothetical protein
LYKFTFKRIIYAVFGVKVVEVSAMLFAELSPCNRNFRVLSECSRYVIAKEC